MKGKDKEKSSPAEGGLPPPHELAAPRDDVKVTLALSRRSVDFFKTQAKANRTKYQRMIRELVDKYADRYSSPAEK